MSDAGRNGRAPSGGVPRSGAHSGGVQSGGVQSGGVQSGGVQSVGRAFRLLEAVGSSPSGLTELARRVDLPVSTTSRLLGTLEALGAVERSDDLGIYRIGASILTITRA